MVISIHATEDSSQCLWTSPAVDRGEFSNGLKSLCPETNSEGKDRRKKKDKHFPLEPAAAQEHPSRTPHFRKATYSRERLIDLIEQYQAPPRCWRNISMNKKNLIKEVIDPSSVVLLFRLVV
jgi:hypothetical protein